jgi:hypothetical protein
MLEAPPWVRFDDPDQLSFPWDDALGGAADFGGSTQSTQVVRTALRIEPRARMALAVALTEWIVWRFDGLHGRSQPAAFVEAAWCATADPRYLRFFEVPRQDWQGPIEGPLWCAITHLRHAIAVGVDFPRDLYDGLSYLARLAAYVQPTPGPLQAWLPPVLDRLETAFPVSPEDPLADLFSRDPSSRMGPWVAREVFDPALPLRAPAGPAFLQEVLDAAHRERNPFLSSPEDLKDARFTGVPYRLA